MMRQVAGAFAEYKRGAWSPGSVAARSVQELLGYKRLLRCHLRCVSIRARHLGVFRVF
jgi:hypothetical protein